jgi:hypothetical protein
MNIEPYIAQLYIVINVLPFRIRCILTEINRQSGLKAQIHFSSKMISFNANLKNNDGLLANHIAQSENLL